MPFTHDTSPTDTSTAPTETETDLDFSPPRDWHVVAVAVTVCIVGVFLFALITWLLLRLRRRPADEVDPSLSPRIRRIFTLDNTRLSIESKFSFRRKPLRVAHQQDDGSWDFSDPDPTQIYIPPAPKCQLSPVCTLPRSNRSSIYKGEMSPTHSDLEAPPPAYCVDGTMWSMCTPPTDHPYQAIAY
ncbi:uncharacterized protein EDB93DRAFT_1119842 [Suillus bovinus]|uniref:uncharacterized protein n=1 Tax=Suillus bovinus TaxID=48563 RepID=UPI001B8770DD|nr:uncharacterized protein EDB93DRAFT_1119842 [Suillus bovinus]KAG2158690.1 hypothetical protein EDB93DRAFT_1119842 [Suillus bovinus]